MRLYGFPATNRYTPLLNAPASSLAPFVAPFGVPPMQPREVDVPIPTSSAIIVSKPKELEGSIDTLRARYSTMHSSTTLSQQIRNREQGGEADNDEEDRFEFVESFEEGKEKAKPMPSPGLVPSPSVVVAIAPLIEEKKEKENERGEEVQEQTQEMTAGEALAHAAHSDKALSMFTTNVGYNLDADWGTPTKKKLEKAAVNAPAAIPATTPPISTPSFWTSSALLPGEGDKSKTTAPRLFGFPAIGSTEAPKKTGPTTGLRSMDEFNHTKPTTDERVFPLTGGYLSSRKVDIL